ncbi:UPF0348 protein [Clostridia bacterium]|nr:UPF0348 protein [Clostridia bacterium]
MIGIICEYNPFHAGHALHMRESRRISIDRFGGDTPPAIICAMSGSVTQRGEPAILDKWTRAEAAVRAGANLVLELPAPFACSSAENFARAGVELLAATGIVDTLSFGSECGEVAPLAALTEEPGNLAEFLKQGLSWADAMRKAVGSPLLELPNNLLGAYYLRELRGRDIQPITVKRDMSLPTASELRKSMGGGLSNDRVTLAVLSRLKIGDWARIADVSEGLEHRLYRAARSASSVGEMLENVRTRRYSEARIRRIILRAYLGITRDFSGEVPYLRVLSIDRVGAGLLKTMKKTASLPIITKPASYKRLGERQRAFFELERDITAFLNPENPNFERELTTSPVIV